MSNAVTVTDVTKRYSTAADSGGVFDINTHIPAGRFTTLLGESGSGKTTLLRLLAGFLRPDAGVITMNETTVASDSVYIPTQRRDLAMVFQSYALWPHMTVVDNVGFGLRARKIPKSQLQERVQAALTLVGLGHLGSRRPGQLSGGQQQRVALARSLVLEPSLLLLDEPLSNLDADLRQQMRNQLKALQLKTGITFVYVTHDQEEAFALSDHLIVLDQGRILQQGTCGELYHRPSSERVARFMGRGGLHLRGIVTSTSDTECVFTADAAGDARPDRLEIPLRPPAPLPVGTAANVLVHSEAVHIVDDAGTAARTAITLPGDIESVSFAGRESHIDVRVSDDCVVTVFESVDRRLDPHQHVALAFDPQDAWLYEADADATTTPISPATDAKSLSRT